MREETTNIFTHSSHRLANVEEETTSDKLHHKVNHIVDNTAGWLLNLTLIAILNQLDDAGVLEWAENLDFGFNWSNRVFFFRKEVFFEHFNCDLLGGVANWLAKINLRGVAFAKGLDNVVFLVENWVLGFVRH